MTQPSGPKPPPNERLAEILLKAISAASITAGGAGAFWQLFKQDDIPKAISPMKWRWQPAGGGTKDGTSGVYGGIGIRGGGAAGE